MFASDEELLRLREEAEEADKQRDNRKRASRPRQRRQCRRRGKGNEAVDTVDKWRKEGEQVEPIRRTESRLKDPPLTRSLWEKTIRDGKVEWVQRETIEEEERDERRVLLCKIYENDPNYFHQIFDSSSEESSPPRSGSSKSEGMDLPDLQAILAMIDARPSSDTELSEPEQHQKEPPLRNLLQFSKILCHRSQKSQGRYSCLERHGRHPRSRSRSQLQPV